MKTLWPALRLLVGAFLSVAALTAGVHLMGTSSATRQPADLVHRFLDPSS